MTPEQDRVQMEADRNAAEDEYFAARPLADCRDRRIGILHGYERGWNKRNKKVMELQAEVARLNKWADDFSDAQIKERLTGEMYQRELQARIDELMLEYCPKEVTGEQMAEYAKHQKAIRTLDATWEEPTL